MRHFNILFAFAFVLLTSCFTDEVDYVGYQPSSKGGIHIIGAVEDYDVKSVGTRADDDGIADSYISEMTMFIFKGDGTLIQGYSDAGRTQACTSAINIQRGNPTFLIDTEEGILADLSGSTNSSEVFYDNTTNDLGSCHIYIVANAWDQLILKDDKGNRHIDNIKTLADLEAFVYNVDSTLAMPMIDEDSFRGFPMIGKQQGNSFNLHKEGNNDNNSVATIPLKKLYSKVCFTMQINADQVVAGQTPSFKIDKVEVFNVPNKVRMGRKLDANGKPVYGNTNTDDYITEMVNDANSGYDPTDYYQFTGLNDDDKPFIINSFNKRTISHSTSLTTDDVIEFGFYMPEHKVTPNPIQLPSTMTPEEKVKYAQYYKPTGVGAVRNGDGTTSAAKIATFVRIHGSYTDHNGQILGVKYDIYLGQNNYDDFTVKRNQQLNNKLIITGLTNHKNAYNNEDINGDGKIDEKDLNISIDHRVEVSDRGFNLSMERTAILDAHFEVRPLDIELQAGASMTVTIPEAYRDWVAMEDDAAARSGKNSSLYVNTSTARKGVRKYFTTNLVSELNAAPSSGTTGNGGTLFFENNTKETKTFRVWFYIDENPNVYDKTFTAETPDNTNGYTVSKEQYRVCPVQFVYNGTKVVKDDATGESETVAVTNTETINFQQWNLWRVWAKDANGNPVRYYDIEHEEEYLNNYASDLQYGQTQNGMPWGLDEVQLSETDSSIYAIQSGGSGFGAFVDFIGSVLGAKTAEEFANTALKEYDIAPCYDFYLSRDIQKISSAHQDKFTVHNYSGLFFTKEISKYLKENYSNNQIERPGSFGGIYQVDKLNLTQAPQSAIAYCYHKNKRNSDGTIDADKIRWYLPAIDEIEEIAQGAYDEFNKVFQNELYWSSQPAFTQNELNVSKIGNFLADYGKLNATFYEDDLNRARATFVYTLDGGQSWVPCSSDAPGITTTISGVIDYVKIANYIDFSKLKTQTNTITDYSKTPGNKARTESCRIRAVYRSGTK